MPDRQRAHFGVHLSREYGAFEPELTVHNYRGGEVDYDAIAHVEVVDGLYIQTHDPAILRKLGQVFLKAAVEVEEILL